ncbi:MAG TPA: hypothetical protein VLE96_01295 [Chlamydiales bacterium]|nr:hypothetical protein [Chlamydiales bacterium]
MNHKDIIYRLIVAVLLVCTTTPDVSHAKIVARDISIKGSNVATIAQTDSGNILFQSSTDAGVTWTNPIQVSTFFTSGNSLPQIAVGGTDNSLVALTYNNISEGAGFFYSDSLTTPQGFQDQPPLINSGVNRISFLESELFILNAEFHNFYIIGGQGMLLQTATDFSSPNNIQPISMEQSPEVLINDLSTSGLVPAFLAASSSPARVLGVAPVRNNWDGPPQASVLFVPGEKIYSPWKPFAIGQIPGFENLGPRSQIQLVAFDDLSNAALVWLNTNGGLSSSLFSYPILLENSFSWSDPRIDVSFPVHIGLVGGLNVDPSTSDYVLQTLCATIKGHLVLATGSVTTGLTSIQALPERLSQNVRQISRSTTRGNKGWWIVLQVGPHGGYLSLVSHDSSSSEPTHTLLLERLTHVADHNISMVVATDEVSGNVVAIFDVASPDPRFFHPVQDSNGNIAAQNTTVGPGTFACTLEGGDVSKLMIRKIN